jgi:hypothetical protein
MTTAKSVRPRPPLWKKLSIARGDLIQSAGLAAGAALLALAASMPGPGPARLAVALLGFLVIYDCSHAIGHYLACRAVGIRFRFYGIRGTDAGLRAARMVARDDAFLAERMGNLDSSTKKGGAR